MKRGNKKGLSPVIASVLMIMLVLVLAAMIFLWARGFISEQIEKFGKPVEELCASVDFQVERVTTHLDDYLEIFNRGNVDIWHLDIKMFKGGNSEISKFDFPVDAGDVEKKSVTLMMGPNKDIEPDEIIVYPALLGGVRGKDSNRAFTCVNAGITI